MSTHRCLLPALLAGLALPQAGEAQTALPTSDPTDTQAVPAPQTGTGSDIVVTGRLDAARDRIAPNLGAVSYTIGPAQLAATPQGDNASFNQVLLRAPGVVLDSFGEEHVRGEHGGLTYRINGVLLPEGLNGFGQELDTRIIRSVSLVTGSLPAQFGFRTAGIVDVTAKSGASLKGNEISLYGGTNDRLQPSFQIGGTGTSDEYFVSGSYLHDGVGIENPTSSYSPLHDNTDQGKLFAFTSHPIDDSSRLSIITNGNYARFELPDTPGLVPAYQLAGVSDVRSRDVDERQSETNGYLVLSFQKQAGALDFQVSPYVRYGRIAFTADRTRDLVFQGVAADVTERFLTAGIQADSSYALASDHTVRFGLIAQHTAEHRDSDTLVFAVDGDGAQSSKTPIRIADAADNGAWEAGLYLQDEWKLTPSLTLNYGARYDRFDANFDHEGQFSPRANLVWAASAATTLHLGYARYFAPPTAQYLSPASLSKFAGTTEAPETFTATPTRVERSDYLDAGIQQVLRPGWQVTADGFYKRARNLGDLGQFGTAVILSPFSYRRGTIYGGELSTTWARGPWNLFGNVSYVNTSATDINSAQYEFPLDELAYIANHQIKLDHEGEYSASAGASWATHGSRVYLDLLYGYGLRSGFANLNKQPSYVTFNLGGEHGISLGSAGQQLTVRLDVVNVFDRVYQIRNGSGLGISAAQYGRRRGLFLGVTKRF